MSSSVTETARWSVSLAAPVVVASIYVGVNLTVWVALGSLALLAVLSVVSGALGEHAQKRFLAVCTLAMLPMTWGWHLVTPTVGIVLLLTVRRARPPLRHLFGPSPVRAPAFMSLIVVACVGAYAAASRGGAESAGSFGWTAMPGTEWGPAGAVLVVLVASVVNASFEEIVWRAGLAGRVVRSRAHTALQWVIVSACFGIAHVNGTPGGILGMALASLFGLAMCALRALSRGSVAWCIGVHVVADVILLGGIYGVFV